MQVWAPHGRATLIISLVKMFGPASLKALFDLMEGAVDCAESLQP
jgi:hypothetical protein